MQHRVVAAVLLACAGCRALELDLTIADGSVSDLMEPIVCIADAAACVGTATPRCAQEAGVCVQCVSEEDCRREGGTNTPHCVQNSCIACQADQDCNESGSDAGRVCNQGIPRCATSCAGNIDACHGAGEGCALAYGYCVQCTLQQPMANAPECQGKPAGSYCLGLPSGACGCHDDTDCPDAGRCQPPAGPHGLRFCGAQFYLM